MERLVWVVDSLIEIGVRLSYRLGLGAGFWIGDWVERLDWMMDSLFRIGVKLGSWLVGGY